MIEHTSFDTKHTVDFDTPNKCLMVRKSAQVAKTIALVQYAFLLALLFSFLYCFFHSSSSHKYIKVDCDMRKFSNQSCRVNVDFMTCSHQWLLLSFVQIILSGDTLKKVTENNINRSIVCLLTNACLRLLLSSFIRFSFLAALRFLFVRRLRTITVALIHCPLTLVRF